MMLAMLVAVTLIYTTLWDDYLEATEVRWYNLHLMARTILA